MGKKLCTACFLFAYEQRLQQPFTPLFVNLFVLVKAERQIIMLLVANCLLKREGHHQYLL